MRSYLDILAKIEETGNKAWLVGDTVRMILMNVKPDVVSLAVDTDDIYGLAVALENGAVDARGPYPALRGEILGVPFRAFPLRGDSIEDDLACRDLSIEAIAIRSDGGIVDPFGGRFDIRNRVIRLTGDNVDLIKADPLRILRMLRFSAELEMDIFWKTTGDVREFLERHSSRMIDIPAERWGREIVKGLARRPYKFMRLCDSFRLIKFFLSELEDLKGISDGKENGRSIFDHVFRVLEVIEQKLEYTKVIHSEVFVLAGLLGHIGLKTLGAKGRTKFTDHLITEYMTSWNIPSEIISGVLAILNGYESFYKPMSERAFCKAVLKYSREPVEVAAQFAKCVAQAEGFIDEVSDTLSINDWNLAQVLRRFTNVSMQTEGASRYLTGREVMSLLNMKPGRRVGELLDGLDIAVGTGKVNSRAGAEAWLRAQ